MKRNPDFILRSVADTQILVPVGAAANTFTGMVTVNGTSAYLWELLETDKTEEALVKAILDRYDIDEATARPDVRKFIETLSEIGAIQ